MINMKHKYTEFVRGDVFKAGDIICSDMHLHMPNTGECKGWEVSSPLPLEISEDQFEELIERAYQGRTDRLPTVGKAAYLINQVIGIDDNVSAMLVIYKYDFSYYLSHLTMPGRFDGNFED